MVTVLNNSTQGRYDIWPLGDVSGTSSKGKKNVNGKTMDKKNSLYLGKMLVLLLPANSRTRGGEY